MMGPRGVNELVRSVSLWEAITVSFGRDHKDTIYVLFYTLRQKKTGFRVLSKTLLLHKTFFILLFLERREREARRGGGEGNTEPMKCSFGPFFLLHFHF